MRFLRTWRSVPWSSLGCLFKCMSFYMYRIGKTICCQIVNTEFKYLPLSTSFVRISRFCIFLSIAIANHKWIAEELSNRTCFRRLFGFVVRCCALLYYAVRCCAMRTHMSRSLMFCCLYFCLLFDFLYRQQTTYCICNFFPKFHITQSVSVTKVITTDHQRRRRCRFVCVSFSDILHGRDSLRNLLNSKDAK